MDDRLDLALVVPSLGNSYGLIEKAHTPEFNLGVGYIASYLKGLGYSVSVFDMTVTGGSFNETVAQLARMNPRVLGFTVTTPLYGTVKRMAALLRGRLPDTLFICGGPHPTARAEDCLLDADFDLVAIGEGEGTCADILEAVGEGAGFHHVAGIAYRQGEQVVTTGPSRRMELDALPFPLRDGEIVHLYKNQIYFDDPGATCYNLLTTRGCPYRCTFCGASTVFPGAMRRRSAENVFAEINDAYTRFNVRYFFFEDSTFVFDEAFVHSLCEKILAAGLGITWGAMGRLNHVDTELYRLLKKAGCTFLFFGVESGDNDILAAIKKNFTVEQAFKALRLVKQTGIASNCSFILGLPGDTPETIEKTIQTAVHMNPDYVSFSLATPYPGTELWEQCLADGWSPPPWEAYETSRYRDPVYVPSALTLEQLKLYLRQAYHRFYFRPSYALKHLAHIRRPSTLWHHARAAFSFLGSSRKEKKEYG